MPGLSPKTPAHAHQQHRSQRQESPTAYVHLQGTQQAGSWAKPARCPARRRRQAGGPRSCWPCRLKTSVTTLTTTVDEAVWLRGVGFQRTEYLSQSWYQRKRQCYQSLEGRVGNFGEVVSKKTESRQGQREREREQNNRPRESRANDVRDKTVRARNLGNYVDREQRTAFISPQAHCPDTTPDHPRPSGSGGGQLITITTLTHIDVHPNHRPIQLGRHPSIQPRGSSKHMLCRAHTGSSGQRWIQTSSPTVALMTIPILPQSYNPPGPAQNAVACRLGPDLSNIYSICIPLHGAARYHR